MYNREWLYYTCRDSNRERWVGFAPQSESEFMKIPQIGNVILEDNVEIGANVAIDRATMGSTIIRRGAKLDNLVQIGHNVEVGENTVMAGQTGIAGSTRLVKTVCSVDRSD